MNIEYEATFPNINKTQIRAKLKKAGAKLARPEFSQKRIAFYLPKSRKTGQWLRVRDEGGKITMSYKAAPSGKKGKIDDQKEICLQIDDFNQGVEFLTIIGCKRKAYQETKREIWKLGKVEIVIDTWPFLEPLIEVEGPTEQAVKNACKKLGLNYSQAKFCTVTQIYKEKYNIPPNKINNKISKIIFKSPNPFIKK